MSNKLKAIRSLNPLSPEAIQGFTNEYGDSIQELIIANNESEKSFQKVLLDVISELYFRLRNAVSFDEYEPEVLVYTLAYLSLKKNLKGKDRKAIILTRMYYESSAIKLLTAPFVNKEEKCASIIKAMGEPGRTILRLSFFDNKEDDQIVNHVHFETIEQLQSRRVKLMDRCIESKVK
jgi:hypothetical protein